MPKEEIVSTMISEAISVTVADSGTESTVGGMTFLGFTPDAAWDTQNVTFQKLGADGAYHTIYDPDTTAAYTISGVVANGYYPVNPVYFLGVTSLKLVSASAQSGASVINLTLVLV